jgi:hypothetical protein
VDGEDVLRLDDACNRDPEDDEPENLDQSGRDILEMLTTEKSFFKERLQALTFLVRAK